MAFVDHGRAEFGEPVAGLLQPGNAGSNTAVDHIETAGPQLPEKYRRGRHTLISPYSGAGTHVFVIWPRRAWPVAVLIGVNDYH